MKRIEIKIGQRFERLIVISGPIVRKKHVHYLCRCDCGQETLARGSGLIAGHTRSCNCIKKELDQVRLLTHGQTYTPEYQAWYRMIARCKPDSPDHANYYDRGIRVCVGLNDRETFLKVLGPMPEDKPTIDRIDNDGGYWDGICDECKAAGHPLNVRWTTRKVQQHNRRPFRAYSNLSHIRQAKHIVENILANPIS